MRVYASVYRCAVLFMALVVAVAPTATATAAEGYPMAEDVHVHNQPSVSRDTRIGMVWEGERVEILCQDNGPKVHGNEVWDFIEYRIDGTTRTKRGFVADYYVRTGVVGLLPGVPFGDCGGGQSSSDPWASCKHDSSLSAVDLGHRWAAGQGGCYTFVDGDRITEQLRTDPWLQDITRWLALNGEGGEEPGRTPEGFFAGSLSKSLADLEESARAAARDPENVKAALEHQDTADMAVTYLGSYRLDYRAVTLPTGDVQITYDIRNVTTIVSATRIPFIGYWWGIDASDPGIRAYEALIIPRQYQNVHMTFAVPRHYGIACEVAGNYCPPAQDNSI